MYVEEGNIMEEDTVIDEQAIIEYVYEHNMCTTEYIEYVLSIRKPEIREKVINYLTSEYKDYKFSNKELEMMLTEFIGNRHIDILDNMYDFLYDLKRSYIAEGLMYHAKEIFGDDVLTDELKKAAEYDYGSDDMFFYNNVYSMVHLDDDGLEFLQIPNVKVKQFYNKNHAVPQYRKNDEQSLLDLYDKKIKSPGRCRRRDNIIDFVIAADAIIIEYRLVNKATNEEIVQKYGKEAAKIVTLMEDKTGAILHEWKGKPQLFKVAEAYLEKSAGDLDS